MHINQNPLVEVLWKNRQQVSRRCHQAHLRYLLQEKWPLRFFISKHPNEKESVWTEVGVGRYLVAT
jgi:hypothetical protein